MTLPKNLLEEVAKIRAENAAKVIDPEFLEFFSALDDMLDAHRRYTLAEEDSNECIAAYNEYFTGFETVLNKFADKVFHVN